MSTFRSEGSGRTRRRYYGTLFVGGDGKEGATIKSLKKRAHMSRKYEKKKRKLIKKE